MKVAFPLLITVTLFVQGAFACTIDYTPIEELIEDADHIFIGYVVEINYVDYEAYIKETYENRPYKKGEDEPLYIGSVMYDYRTLPVEIFKKKMKSPVLLLVVIVRVLRLKGLVNTSL